MSYLPRRHFSIVLRVVAFCFISFQVYVFFNYSVVGIQIVVEQSGFLHS